MTHKTQSPQPQTPLLSGMDQPALPPALAQYPVIHHQRVQWGEMDAFNHLNNVVYYRYAESARIAYLQALGMFHKDMVMVLAQSDCQYLRAVTYPDTLLIGVRCRRLGTTSAVLEYSYYSDQQQQVVATASAVVVRLSTDASTKMPWSEQERQALLNLDHKVGHTPICASQ